MSFVMFFNDPEENPLYLRPHSLHAMWPLLSRNILRLTPSTFVVTLNPFRGLRTYFFL